MQATGKRYIMEGLGNVLLKIMWIAILLMPCSFVVFRVAHTMNSCWDRNGIIYIICASMVIVSVTILISRMVPVQLNRRQKLMILIAMFAVSIIARTLVSVLLQTTPQSDFAMCYRYAAGQHVGDDAYYLARFPYLGAYAVTLRNFFELFPATVFSSQVMNAIATSFIPIFLFLGVEKAEKNAKQAVLVGLTYALYPALIIYTAIPSCEHFSQLFFAIGFYFLTCEIETPYKMRRRKIMWTIATGVAFGLMCVYKELFIIAVPALLMASFCYDYIPAVAQRFRMHQKNREIIYVITRNILLVIVILAVFKLTVAGVQLTIGGEMNDRNTPIGVPIYRGLALEGRGVWNPSVNSICAKVCEESANNSEANRIFMQKLVSEYQENLPELFNVIREKMQTDFCDEGVYWYWTFSGENTILQKTWVGELLGALFPSAFFMVMCGIMVIGLVGQVMRKKTGNQSIFFATGVVFLFVLLLVLMEAQGRYKSNIMPYFFILYSLSVESLFEMMQKVLKKVNVLKKLITCRVPANERKEKNL